jgi:hypothetical protein
MLDTPRRATEMKIQFAECAFSGDQSWRLPQGDVLAFGGDIAYFPEALRGHTGCVFRDRLSHINI